MKFSFYAVFVKEKDSDWYSVEFPDIQGCITCGEGLEEAEKMAQDALKTMIECKYCNHKLLKRSTLEQLRNNFSGDIIKQIDVEIDDDFLNNKKIIKNYVFPVVFQRDNFKQRLIHLHFPDFPDGNGISAIGINNAVDKAFEFIMNKLIYENGTNVTASDIEKVKKAYTKAEVYLIGADEDEIIKKRKEIAKP